MAREPQNVKSFLIFVNLSALYIFSMFYRVSNAVIAPNLVRDLGLDAETLGLLGGAFFYSFTLLQIPMGPMLDRIGPRLIIASFAMIGALGSFLFAFGHSLTTALFGRVLIGAGMACMLMGGMKVFMLKFSPRRFATISGIYLSIGTLGNIFAASPLAYLTSTIGWRTTFILAGGISAILAFFFWWTLGAEKTDGGGLPSLPVREKEIGISQSVRLVLGSLAFWQIGAVTFFRYGTFVGLQGLWLGPYLMDTQGYSPVQTGNMLILLAVGTILGSPLAGRFSDKTFHARKRVALWGLSLYGLTLFPLTGIFDIPGPLGYAFLFFFIGLFNGFGLIVYSHAKELFPTAISGTVMTWVNFFTMAGAAIIMPALGKVIEFFPRSGQAYPQKAYHVSFLVCFLGMAVSLIFYAFSRSEKTQSP